MFGVIYKITNLINGNIYIGQTIQDISIRWRKHCSNKNGCPYLSKAIKKYGKENFKIEIICRCNSIEELNHRETYCIKIFKTLSPNGYNLSLGGGNKIPTQETRKKMSIAKLGKPSHNKGKPALKYVILKLNEGKNRYIAKYGHPSKGKIASENTRKKLSESHKGYKMPDSQKKNISKSNKGKKRTEEHKNKYSNCKSKLKRKVFCPELNMNFDSIGDAAKYTGAWRQNIGKVMLGELKKTKGLTFIRIAT